MTDDKVTSEKAYNKGCMWGMSGKPNSDCPFDAHSDAATQWLKGWQQGHTAWQRQQRHCQVG